MWWLAGVMSAHAGWDDTLETVTRSVVAIKTDVPRGFDGKGAANSQATGFVIDAERGLLLTNRHVVTPGPVRARATFYDMEEVPLTPVYRDPVHDFGLYRYDPADLEHMTPPALPLSPERAKVGLEIRVVGNDGGEQLQILDGTLARLDRAAPRYGPGYNDFNTFYLQAASATSGGSSGSPVVDEQGHVVGLNAGSNRRNASAFYLPLDRVVRAVERIRAGDAVTRGTIQTTVEHATYDELARLQVDPSVLASARERRPEGTGLLVARAVLPGGPAAGALEVGDVVLFVSGTAVHDHVTLEGVLDAHVGETLELEVARGPQTVRVEVTVQDLFAITPDRFLEVGGAVLHPLSYHQARGMQTRVAGISVSDTGALFDGLPANAVVLEVDGVEVGDLEALDAQLAGFEHGRPFAVRYYELGRPQETFLFSARMNRRWHDQRLCVEDPEAGRWPCRASEVSDAVFTPPRVEAKLPPVEGKLAAKLQSSLVRLEVDIPYQYAGVPSDSYSGVGVVVGDGLLLTDRDTVPEAMADVTVRIGGVARLPAEVVALHPVHGLALLRFDPAPLEGVALSPVALREDFEVGDALFFVGLSSDQRLTVREVEVTGRTPLQLPDDGIPRFRQTGSERWVLEPVLPGIPGVLVDKKGRVGALWVSQSYTSGRDTKAAWTSLGRASLDQTLALASPGGPGRALPWEIVSLPLDKAAARGVPPERVASLQAADPTMPFALAVRRVMAGSALQGEIRPGDVVLAVDGQPVNRAPVLEAKLQGADAVKLTLWRGKAEVEVEVETAALDPIGVDRVLLWNGLRVHRAHRAAQLQGLPACPYVSWRNRGSPAGRAGIYSTRCVLAVNGEPTPDLDALLAVDATLEDGQPVRLDLVRLNGKREVFTLLPDHAFWPTVELRYDDGDWERIRHTP